MESACVVGARGPTEGLARVLAVVVATLIALVGANASTAHAYPPDVGPKISDPVYALPSTVVTILVTGAPPGSDAELTFDGRAYQLMVGDDGRLFFTPRVPRELGTYPVVVTLADGTVLTTEVIVVDKLPDDAGPLASAGSTQLTRLTSLGAACVLGGITLLFVARRRRWSLSA